MDKRILLLGATGMVGQQVLQQLIDHSDVKEIVVIGRKASGFNHPKVKEIQLVDFSDFSSIKPQLKGIDACIYCIGVYQNQVSKDVFYEITCTYQKALTDVLEEESPNCAFVLMGAQGADPTGNSKVTFADAKGKAENLLLATQFPTKTILRPGYIQPTGTIKSGGWVYALMRPVANLFMLFAEKSIGIKDRDLASGLIQLALRPVNAQTRYENKEIYTLIGK